MDNASLFGKIGLFMSLSSYERVQSLADCSDNRLRFPNSTENVEK